MWSIMRRAIQLHTKNKQSHLKPIHNCSFVSRIGPMVSFRGALHKLTTRPLSEYVLVLGVIACFVCVAVQPYV